MEEKTIERIKKLKREKWERRKKKIKVFFIIFGIIFAIIGFIEIKRLLISYLWNLEIFKIKRIEVYPENLTPLLTGIIELERGTNLLFVDIKSIERRIKSLKTVEKCEVIKIFPSTLQINIYLRKPWVILKKRERSVTIDREGVIIPSVENKESYWQVEGIEFGNGVVKEKDKIGILREIERWYNFFNIATLFKIKRVDMSNVEKIILDDGERKVYLYPSDLKKEFENLKIVIGECKKRDFKWEYIDMRFKNPYVKKKNE